MAQGSAEALRAAGGTTRRAAPARARPADEDATRAAEAVIAPGSATVHVSGITLDLVPVWFRFGAIVPLADLQPSDPHCGGGSVRGQNDSAAARTQTRARDPVRHEAGGSASALRAGAVRATAAGRGCGETMREDSVANRAGAMLGRHTRPILAGGLAGRAGAAGAAEGGACCGGADASVNASAIDFGGVLTAEEALRQRRWLAVLLSAERGAACAGRGTACLRPYLHPLPSMSALRECGAEPALGNDGSLSAPRDCGRRR